MNVDYQEKMDQAHRSLLCRMLNVKNLPEDLLLRYAQVKRLVDRIDGHLTPGDLAMIIISVGVNPDLQPTKIPPELLNDVALQAEQVKADEIPSVGQTLNEADDKVIEQAAEAVASGVAKPAGPLDEFIKVNEEKDEPPGEQPVSGATGQAENKPFPKIWSLGMPVRALIDDELKKGKIVGISNPSEVGKQVGAAVQLTVEIDGGEIVTVEEDEVEAI